MVECCCGIGLPCCGVKKSKLKKCATIPLTRRYVRTQRWYLHLHLTYNILLPYWTLVVPLFVMAGPAASGLESYFVLVLLVLAQVFWSFLCRTASSYPPDAINGLSFHYRNPLEHHLTEETRAILEESGRRKSTPSLLKVLCLAECWKELLLGKIVTCSVLLLYAIVILYEYVTTYIDTSGTGVAVTPSTAGTMYVTFLVSLYYTFKYDGPFHRALVTNDRTCSDFSVLLTLFTTRFPDDLFPVHLSFGDCFRSSADVLVDLRTLAAITTYYRGSQMNILSHLLDANESQEQEDSTDDRSRLSHLHKRTQAHSTVTDDGAAAFTPSRQDSVETLIEDDRFSDNNWDMISESMMSPESQVAFLYMINAYLNEGITRHIGIFLESRKIEALRMANMLATIDEHRTIVDYCSVCHDTFCARGLCCCCKFCCKTSHAEVQKAWKSVDDIEIGSISATAGESIPESSSIER